MNEEKQAQAGSGHGGDGEARGETRGEGEDSKQGEVIRNEAEYFSDWHNVKLFLEQITRADLWKDAWEQKWEAISMSLLIFQEQPTLLTPHLESIIVPLTLSLIEILQRGEDEEAAKKFQRMENSQFHVICKVLQLFCRIRGYKHVIKHFPHEVWHIELCMSALRAQDKTDYSNWETRYIMLLWLCMLCLIPFDICSMDSTMSLQTKTFDASDTRHEHQSKLVLDMISICKEHLSESGPTREAGYACLSALFTRPDMEASILSDFMTWGCARLRAWADKGAEAEWELNRESFQLIGLLHCLSQIFKKGHRNNLLPFAAQVLEPCLLLTEQPNQTLVRKLLVKVCQRIALTFLPPREAAWRYQRGSRSLLQNLQQSTGQTSTVSVSHQAEEEEDDIEIPEEMEEIVEKLLTSLRDKDTVVRWSAAKGIGRITMRLPQGFGDDVVGAVISIFDDPEADSAWHGGCLALAELSRRGLLLPSRLDTVVPIVVNAMHFDQIRGQHSVGAHVRDAASYVCWAFARAYAPSVMRPYISTFTEAMVLAALFDREINCRRAASAAFQENVGRQGNENFPHGIEVIAIADYFSLGNRTSAYLTIAPQIAKMSPEFLTFMVKHLSKVKLGHWDPEIRSLSAKSLGQLSRLDATLTVSNLREILVHCMSSIPNLRHGSLLAIGEIVQAHIFHNSSQDLPTDLVTEITEIILKLEKGRMFRGKGGESLREASCILIQLIARAQLPMPIKTQVSLVEFLNENLRQPHEHIQMAGAAGLRLMLYSYFPVSPTDGPTSRLQTLTVTKYMEGLRTEENIAAARGYALALGTLPYRLISKPLGRIKEVFHCLSDACDPTKRIAGEADAETRRNAINSIVELAEKIIPQIKSAELEIYPEVEGLMTSAYSIRDVLGVLLKCCEDYSVDKRGDIGSWCRIAGLKGLERLVFVCCRHLDDAYPRSNSAKYSYILPLQTLSSGTHSILAGAHVMTPFGHAVVENIVAHSSGDSHEPLVVSVSYPRDSFGASFDQHDDQLLMAKGLILLGYSFACIGQVTPFAYRSPDLRDRRTSLLRSLDCSGISSITLQETARYMQREKTMVPSLTNVSSIEEAEMKSVMALVFRFLGEKLDAVRDVAADVLESFLHSQDPPLDLIPDKPIILGCLASIQKRLMESPHNTGKSGCSGGHVAPSHGRWTQSKYVYTFLTGILDSNHYFKAVVSGIVISIGALSEGIGKESFNALLHWCQVQHGVRNLRDLSMLGSALLELFQDNSRNSRVTLPVMKSLHSLLKNDVFNPILSSQSTASPFAASFGTDLLRCVEKELYRCTEMAKIRAGVDLCLLLLMLDEPVRSSTWKTLLVMTGHRYPKIRKYVAELLYVQLISDSYAVGPSAAEVKAIQERDLLVESKESEKGKRYLTGLAPDKEALEKAMEILTTTVWDEENLAMAREKRQSLCTVLHIELALRPKAGSGTRGKSEDSKVDELDSYDSLVRDAGY